MDKEYQKLLIKDHKTELMEASKISPNYLEMTERQALEMIEYGNKKMEQIMIEHPEKFNPEHISIKEKNEWKIQFMDFVYKGILYDVLKKEGESDVWYK